MLSIETNSTVKTWGGTTSLGYYTSSPGPPGGGSYVPTTPTGLCPTVPPVAQPCYKLPFVQNSAATYQASWHSSNPVAAEIGNYGASTTIDASVYPNSTVVFDGTYLVRGDLELLNGTFILNPGTVFYVNGGTTGNAPHLPTSDTKISVEKATLHLAGASYAPVAAYSGGASFSTTMLLF